MSALDIHLIHRPSIREIAGDVIGPDGRLKILPASYYKGTTAQERALLGHSHALYGLHTEECISWLRDRIAGRSAIEIGAGDGVLAQALGIHATDSYQQANPKYKKLYEAARQPVITYGENVEKLDAVEAARRYRPDVIVACWVTHRYDPGQHWRGGNEAGVDEAKLLAHCGEYILIGNRDVHRDKPLWPPEELIEPDWLYSRALNGSPNFIGVWKGARQQFGRESPP